MKHLYSQNLKIKMMLVLLLIVALTVPFVNSKFALTKIVITEVFLTKDTSIYVTMNLHIVYLVPRMIF